MSNSHRHSTGVPGLDAHLGGGLIAGTLTVVYGATGIGKTQLGVQFAAAGNRQERSPGIFYDMTSRGDSQHHAEYARQIADWELACADAETPPAPVDTLKSPESWGDYLRIFTRAGRRVTRRDVEFDDWHEWRAELVRKLDVTIGFFYGGFLRGVRRAVVDGIEPTDGAAKSIQLEMFEYIYHQVLRKEADWVARDLLRQHYRQHAEEAARRHYDPAEISCLLLCTSHESMLDELIARPLEQGDLLSGANTVIYLGKTRNGGRFGRGLYVAKHRGSACTEQIIRYEITGEGLRVAEA